MADLNKLIGAALKCSADTLCDDKTLLVCLMVLFVRM